LEEKVITLEQALSRKFVKKNSEIYVK